MEGSIEPFASICVNSFEWFMDRKTIRTNLWPYPCFQSVLGMQPGKRPSTLLLFSPPPKPRKHLWTKLNQVFANHVKVVWSEAASSAACGPSGPSGLSPSGLCMSAWKSDGRAQFCRPRRDGHVRNTDGCYVTWLCMAMSSKYDVVSTINTPGNPLKDAAFLLQKTQCSSTQAIYIYIYIPSNGQCSCTICCEFFLLQPPFLICRIHVKRTNVTLFLERILSKWLFCLQMAILCSLYFREAMFLILAKITKDHFLEKICLRCLLLFLEPALSLSLKELWGRILFNMTELRITIHEVLPSSCKWHLISFPAKKKT